MDIGGVRAGYGERVDPAEEIRRVVAVRRRVRERLPDLVISVDTWRSEVAREVGAAGADLINDAWGGDDPGWSVAAELGAAVVCTHAGGLTPRTDPHRHGVRRRGRRRHRRGDRGTRRSRGRGRSAPESILIDPAHDFGKNTLHSLE